jgi:sugar phosphate isomerase/epimerase
MRQSIRLGICISPDRVAELAPGFDHIEPAVARALIPLQDEAAYAPMGARLAATRPPVRAFNSFVPGQVRLVGEEVDWDQVETYAHRAIQRAISLGAQIIVFGSGGARQVPEGFSRALAWGQLVRFLGICADEAEPHALTIAIEPLNNEECNILNTYLEGVQLAKDVNRDEVRVLADIYHFMMDGEPLDDILEAPDWLAHVHLADTHRRWPGSGAYPLERLFAILHEIDYCGMASIECRWGDDFAAETARSLAFLKKLV